MLFLSNVLIQDTAILLTVETAIDAASLSEAHMRHAFEIRGSPASDLLVFTVDGVTVSVSCDLAFTREHADWEVMALPVLGQMLEVLQAHLLVELALQAGHGQAILSDCLLLVSR